MFLRSELGHRLFSISLMLGLSTVLIAPKVFSVCMVLCLLVALFSMRSAGREFNRTDAWVVVAFLLYPLLSAAHVLFRTGSRLEDLDLLSRFVLIISMYLYCRHRSVAPVYFVVGAVLAGLSSVLLAYQDVVVHHMPRAEGGINSITFAQVAIIAAFYALMGTILVVPRLAHRWRLPMILVCVLAAVSGLTAALLSGSRGPLMVLPVLAVLFWYAIEQRKIRRMMAGLMLAAVFVGGAVVVMHPQLLRVQEAQADIQGLEQGNKISSIGIRTEVWRTGWQLFTEHPILGIGHGQFIETVKAHQQELKIDPIAVGYHAHSDYVQLLAEMGIPGLLSMLIPMLMFATIATRSTTQRKARVAVWGVVACWLVFGLTQVQLMHQRITLLELLCLAFFMAHAVNQSHSVRRHSVMV